jgi:hypothetical protein
VTEHQQQEYRTHVPAPEMETVPGIGRVHRRPGGKLGRYVEGRQAPVYQEARWEADEDLDRLVEVLRKLNPKTTEVTRDNAVQVASETIAELVRVAVPMFEYIRDVWAALDSPLRDLYRAAEVGGLLTRAAQEVDRERQENPAREIVVKTASELRDEQERLDAAGGDGPP